ncbi:MAG: hypothetical protein EA387_00165, partial [Nitriliruptor sp.]
MRWTTQAEDADAADVMASIQRDVPAFLAELPRPHRDRLTGMAPGLAPGVGLGVALGVAPGVGLGVALEAATATPSSE